MATGVAWAGVDGVAAGVGGGTREGSADSVGAAATKEGSAVGAAVGDAEGAGERVGSATAVSVDPPADDASVAEETTVVHDTTTPSASGSSRYGRRTDARAAEDHGFTSATLHRVGAPAVCL